MRRVKRPGKMVTANAWCGARSARAASLAKASRQAVAATLIALPLLAQSAAALSVVRVAAPGRALLLAQGEPARVVLAPTILAAPDATNPLHIGLETVTPLGLHSFVRVRGLPAAITLSQGYAIGPGAWAVPLAALGGLSMQVPAGLSGRSELIVSLHTENGVVLSQARSVLIVTPAPVAPQVRAGKRNGEPAPMTESQREAIAKLIARGEADFEQGNIALARPFFQRAAEAGSARGALLMAETYDAKALERHGVQGVRPNAALARQWYERARSLGAAEADERLSHLNGG